MKVQLKLDDTPVTLGYKGIVLKISGTESGYAGTLRIGSGSIIWMKGKTSEANGKKITLSKLIDLLNAQ